MARVTLLRDADPMQIWQGVAPLNRAGLQLAFQLLKEFDRNEADADGINVTDMACLEDWPRQGEPFQNRVAQALAAAREAGPEVECAFCAVLTDYLAMSCSGSGNIGAGRYAELYGIATK